MAKSKRPNGSKPDFEFKGFLSLTLSTETKNHFRKWLAEGLDDEIDLGELLASGYKFSASYYAGNGNFTCTLTCVNADSENYGYALSAWGPDVPTAMGLVLYKHQVLASGNWRAAVGAVDQSDSIG